MAATPPPMNDFLGKHISAICPFSIGKDDHQNHCAHFVSHALGYDFDETCKNFTYVDKQREEKGATLRVERLFNRALRKGVWDDRPATATSCLIFVTLDSNVRTIGEVLAMGNQPRKHVGVYINGQIWNYSNSQRKVVVDGEAHFLTKFTHAYRTPDRTVEFYYAELI
jgi:hypothetical protein